MDRAAQLAGPTRRRFLRSAAALGGLRFVPSAFAGGTGLVRPTREQLAWSEQEFGMLRGPSAAAGPARRVRGELKPPGKLLEGRM